MKNTSRIRLLTVEEENLLAVMIEDDLPPKYDLLRRLWDVIYSTTDNDMERIAVSLTEYIEQLTYAEYENLVFNVFAADEDET